jgi:DinB superfamily
MLSPIDRYLDLLDVQREAIFCRLADQPEAVLWYRPGPKVWSIGEHLDHTRVINCFTRRLVIAYYPPASIFARLFRHRPYDSGIDDVYKRSGFSMRIAMKMGWIWPPKYRPWRPVSLRFLHDALRAEHLAYRRFFTAHDERLLGHVVLADPVIGALNLVQWLRIQAYHDAHHYERVSVRLDNPHDATDAPA